ncbi:unnamed protein product, partial [Prorocentrum cordatum]
MDDDTLRTLMPSLSQSQRDELLHRRAMAAAGLAEPVIVAVQASQDVGSLSAQLLAARARLDKAQAAAQEAIDCVVDVEDELQVLQDKCAEARARVGALAGPQPGCSPTQLQAARQAFDGVVGALAAQGGQSAQLAQALGVVQQVLCTLVPAGGLAAGAPPHLAAPPPQGLRGHPAGASWGEPAGDGDVDVELVDADPGLVPPQFPALPGDEKVAQEVRRRAAAIAGLDLSQRAQVAAETAIGGPAAAALARRRSRSCAADQAETAS